MTSARGGRAVRVRLRYYANLAERAGRLGEEVELAVPTLDALLAELAARYGGEFETVAGEARRPGGTYLVVVNGEPATMVDGPARSPDERSHGGRSLNDGDSVEIVPPLAGGD